MNIFTKWGQSNEQCVRKCVASAPPAGGSGMMEFSGIWKKLTRSEETLMNISNKGVQNM